MYRPLYIRFLILKAPWVGLQESVDSGVLNTVDSGDILE